MVASGEQSGRLSDTFFQIGRIYEEKIEITTKNLSVILEPILLVIVWLGVAAVAFAVILPIYSLIGGLNQEVSSPAPQPVEVESVAPSADEPLNSKALKILSNPEGYLNINDEPSDSGEVVGRVYPGATYEYIREINGWYEIVLPNNKNGWIFGKYVKNADSQQN